MARFPGLAQGDRPEQIYADREPDVVATAGGRGRGGFSARRNALVDQFPGSKVVPASAQVVGCPPAGFAAPAGQAAWFGMQEVKASGEIPSAFSLVSIYGAMLAADPDASGGNSGLTTTARAWGNDDGTGAAIVVGVDLPVRKGEWIAARCPVPGLGIDGSADQAATFSRLAAVFEFPPGKIDDTTKAKLYPALSFAPAALRVFEGQRLGVAFVLNRTDANAAAGLSGGFGMYARLGLNIAPVKQDPFQPG